MVAEVPLRRHDNTKQVVERRKKQKGGGRRLHNTSGILQQFTAKVKICFSLNLTCAIYRYTVIRQGQSRRERWAIFTKVSCICY